MSDIVKGFTPGPWRVYHAKLRPQFSGKIIEVQGPDGEAVVFWTGFDRSERTKKQHLANARLIGSAPDMAAEIERLRAALKTIAKQKKTDELETACDVEYADFEGGYDACIDVARAALHPPIQKEEK